MWSLMSSYNFGVRKNVFDIVGGFNGRYRYASGEDNDLSYKILKAGYKIYFEPRAFVDHFHTTKVFKYLKEQFRHGYWRAKLYRDHPDMAKGDDYTFWKDIVEVGWFYVVVFVFLVNLIIAGALSSFLFGSILLLGMLELVYAFIFKLSVFDAIFYAIVMFLRAGARAIGLVMGAIALYPNNQYNKI